MGLMMRAIRARGRSSDSLIACAFGVCWILLTVAGQPCARADEFSWPYNTLPSQEIGANWPEYVIESDKDVYQPGEQVHVVHRVTNGLSTPYTFWLRSTPGFDLWVLDAGGVLVWSQHQDFKWDMPILVLPPGESVQHEYAWDMTDYTGNAAAPGEYELVGVIYGDRDVSTTITVVPEPTTAVAMLLAAGAGIWRSGRRRSKTAFRA